SPWSVYFWRCVWSGRPWLTKRLNWRGIQRPDASDAWRPGWWSTFYPSVWCKYFRMGCQCVHRS
ncbi:hypothetical protein IWQ61_010724, partial [Dispira simplex]